MVLGTFAETKVTRRSGTTPRLHQIEPLKRLDLFADPQQHLKGFRPLAQVMEHRQLVGPGIGTDNQRHQFTALLAQIAAQRVLVVPAKVAHHLLDVHRQIHRRFANRQMFVSGHALPSGKDATPRWGVASQKPNRGASKGRPPPAPPR